MKERELRERHLTCTGCSRPVLHAGLPLFWTVQITRYGVDISACRRIDGLAQMLGSSALASIMGPDPDVATPIAPPVTATLCEECATGLTGALPAMLLQERAG